PRPPCALAAPCAGAPRPRRGPESRPGRGLLRREGPHPSGAVRPAPPWRASSSSSAASSSPSSAASSRRLHEGSRPPRRGPPARITLPVRRHPRLRLHWAGGARFSAGGRAEVACSTAHLECGLFCRCVCACADARAVTLFHHPVADSQPLVRVVVEV
ncbi:unnamed protein product, partial [Prorocentrum cordatum]